MLKTLFIENIALIKELEMDFSCGFHALTGETGAGKSILIDSIGLLCGTKADKTLIRTGESFACVRGIFGDFSPASLSAFNKMDIEPDDEGSLLVERVIFTDGRAKVKINGATTTLGVLKELAKYLIDIHGQSDTLTLYDNTSYVGILDAFASVEALMETYRVAFEKYEQVCREIDDISKSEAERVRTIEMLTYQIADIDSVSLKPGEDVALEEKELRLKNHERIFRQCNFVYRALKGAEKGNVALLLERSATAIETLSDVIPDAENIAAEIRECLYQLIDVAERVYDLSEGDDGDPSVLIDKIERRLDAILKLKKKYGATVEAILAYRAEAASRLETLQNADARLQELGDEKKRLYLEAAEIANEIHKRRVEAGSALSQKVVENLVFLDMPKVRFQVDVTAEVAENGQYRLSNNGYDVVEFLISANSGEALHSLSKVASGGELARMMLALKCVENQGDISTSMIFDEIDTGVSGKTARKIGLKLLELSRHTQILCVTHSAQIASLADTHYLIAKREADGRTITTVKELDEEGRIRELSRVLGGISVTDAQRQAAIDMRQEKLNQVNA